MYPGGGKDKAKNATDMRLYLMSSMDINRTGTLSLQKMVLVCGCGVTACWILCLPASHPGVCNVVWFTCVLAVVFFSLSLPRHFAAPSASFASSLIRVCLHLHANRSRSVPTFSCRAVLRCVALGADFLLEHGDGQALWEKARVQAAHRHRRLRRHVVPLLSPSLSLSELLLLFFLGFLVFFFPPSYRRTAQRALVRLMLFRAVHLFFISLLTPTWLFRLLCVVGFPPSHVN